MEIKLLFLEIQVGIAVLVILLAQPGMKKLPRVYSYMLWLVVFARLLIPVSFESRFGLMPSAVRGGLWLEENFGPAGMTAKGDSAGNTVGSGMMGADGKADVIHGDGNVFGAGYAMSGDQGTESQLGTDYGADVSQGIGGAPGAGTVTGEDDGSMGAEEAGFHTGINHGTREITGAGSDTGGNYGAGDIIGTGFNVDDGYMAGEEAGVNLNRNSGDISAILLILWAAGAAVVLVHNGTSLMLVRKRISGAKHLRDNIYTSSQVRSPFTLGVFLPKIYLPPNLGEVEREYIICHEQIHIRRKDYLVKNFVFLLTALHWFNPFVWVAFYLMERDMEMSCDEKVIGEMGQEIKKQYSQSLLNFAKGKCPAGVAPITFGENSVKLRVSNVLTYKTASKWVAVLGTVIIFLLVIMLFTVRSDAQGNETVSNTGSATLISAESSSPAVSNVGATPEFVCANLVPAQGSPLSVLESWARAYTDRNGDILFQLAADKENFKQWEKVTHRGDSFAFGDSSPWPWEYDYEILISPECSTAEITFHMRTSVPEFYLVKETVKVTELDGLYYVDYESTWDNYSIETGKEYEEAYGQSTIFDNGTDNGVSGNFGFYEGNDTGDVSSNHSAGDGYAEMAALYDDAFYRMVLSQLLDGGNPDFYSRFTDPVKAAEQLLHLGAGTAEVTEWNMVPITQLRSGDTELSEETIAMVPHWLMASSAAGVGSQVIVTYTFAKDGSQVEIPMELKEESQGIWGLAGGGIRKVYNMVSEPDMLDYDEEGHTRGVYVIELSNYGIYRMGAHSGLTCLWAGDVGSEAAARIYENKLYIFESLERAEENSEDGTEAVFVYDLLTGELHRERLDIPENYREIFPKVDFGIDGGFVLLYEFGKTYTLPLENLNEVIWNHKTFRQMSQDDQQAYGVENRTYLLSNPDTLVRLSVREPGQTSAFIDLDGDGESEQVILLAGSGEQGQYDGYYRLQTGESVITDMGCRLHNDIWAYSPDGKEIILVLYEDGASNDPHTYLFGYESGDLRALGRFEDDIRACTIKDGVISGRTRCEVIQTDAVYVSWQIGDSGQLEQVPQEVYDFTTLNDIELLEELPVQNVLPPTEEGVYHGIFYFTISPQTVRFLQTDSTFSWVYVEAEDGRRGWFQMDGYTVKGLDKDSREVFEGLWFYD